MKLIQDGSSSWKNLANKKYRFNLKWNVWINSKPNPKKKHVINAEGAIKCLRIDNDLLYTVGERGDVAIWNITSPQIPLHKKFKAHTDWCFWISLSKSHFLTSGRDHNVKLWTKTNYKFQNNYCDENDSVYCVEFYNDGKNFATGSAGSYIRLWDIETTSVQKKLHATDSNWQMQISDNLMISISNLSHIVTVWDLREEKVVHSILSSNTPSGLFSLAFDVNSNLLVTGGADYAIRLHDMRNFKEIYNVSCSTVINGKRNSLEKRILTVQFTADKLICGGRDSIIKLWNLTTGELLNTWSTHTDAVTCIRFNDEHFFSGSADSNVISY